MSKVISIRVEEVPEIINPPPIQKENLKKTGNLNGYKIATVVILGATSALAAIASVITAVFAIYIAAAISAAAFVTLLVSAIVASRIKTVPHIAVEIPTEKKPQEPEIAPIEKQPDNDPKEQELRKRIEQLTQDLEKKDQELAQKPPKDDNLLKNEFLKKQNEIDEQKNEIEKLKKLLEEVPVKEQTKKEPSKKSKQTKKESADLKQENKKLKEQCDQFEKKLQDLKNEQEEQKKPKNRENFEQELDDLRKLNHVEQENKEKLEKDLRKQLENKDLEIQKLKDSCKEEIESIAIAASQAHQKLGDNIGGALASARVDQKQKKKFQSITKQVNVLLPRKNEEKNDVVNCAKLMGLIYRIESRVVAPFDDVQFDMKMVEAAKPFLQEIIETETSFRANILALKSHFDDLINAKLITSAEYKELTVGWDVVIKESSSLITGIKFNKKTERDVLKRFLNYFEPKNIKNYLDAFIIPTSNSLSIVKKLKEVEENEHGLELSKAFAHKHEIIIYGNKQYLKPADMCAMFHQRTGKHPLFMQKIMKDIKWPESCIKVLEHNLEYLTAYMKLINASIPRF